MGGVPVALTAPPAPSVSAAVVFAIQASAPSTAKTAKTKKPKPGPISHWKEPIWRKPSALELVVLALGASNAPALRRGLAYPTNVFDQLPAFRNYFAHKNESTAGQVSQFIRGYALPGSTNPAEALATHLPGRPQSLIRDWIDDVATVVLLSV
jgi:hypothetical protein